MPGSTGPSGFQGLTPPVGATLVVALDGAGTRPAPTFSHTPQIPKEVQYFYPNFPP